MMVSPGSSMPASSWTVSSVILPDGNITHTARGLASFFTMSARPEEAVAPFPSSVCTVPASRS